MPDPKPKHNTIVLEARVDALELAALARYLEEAGLPAHTRSGLINKGLSLLASILVSNGKATLPTSYEAALAYLDRRGLAPTARGGRRRTIDALVEESLSDISIEVATPELDKLAQDAIDKTLERMGGGD